MKQEDKTTITVSKEFLKQLKLAAIYANVTPYMLLQQLFRDYNNKQVGNKC